MRPTGTEPAPIEPAPFEPLHATALCAGAASGRLLVLERPLSFWGGTDLRTGVITDVHHPQHGVSLAGRVVAMTASRGSSSSSSVLAEQLRAGVGPAALILAERDAILALGELAAAELYGIRMPIVLVAAADFALLPTGTVTVRASDPTAHPAAATVERTSA